MGLSKSTVHRLLCALESRAFVTQGFRSGKYRLGVKLFELGLRAVDEQGMLSVGRPRLAALAAETGETAHLGVLREGQVLSVCAVESPRTLRTPATVGRKSPAHSSSQGKAILAFGPPEQLESLISTRGLTPFTANTIADEAAFRGEIARVRDQGYAVDNEEFERGLKCIGAPVRDASGAVWAAVSIAGPANRLGPEEMPALVRAVRRAASELSADLGRRAESVVEPSTNVGKHG